MLTPGGHNSLLVKLNALNDANRRAYTLYDARPPTVIVERELPPENLQHYQFRSLNRSQHRQEATQHSYV
jgi:hypothetical protein